MRNPHLDRLIDLALEEDIGIGDLTTQTCVLQSQNAQARIIAKQDAVIYGLEVIKHVYRRLDPEVSVENYVHDGHFVANRLTVAAVNGPAQSILMGERVALNFLMHLSGVATQAKAWVDLLPKGSNTKLLDTRKTTPGMRTLEKAAVRAGGAFNHRFGLFDGILIKENHIAAAGGITQAIARIRQKAPHLLKIEAETQNVNDVKEAIEARVDVVLLDNMSIETMRECVQMTHAFIQKTGHVVLLEASGNMTAARIAEVAQLNVDFISIGALTHSAQAADFSMLVE